MADHELSIARDAANLIWFDIVNGNMGDSFPFGDSMRIERYMREGITEFLAVRCTVCRYAVLSESIGYIESKGVKWLSDELERVFNVHRHDGSKVKSAGKQ